MELNQAEVRERRNSTLRTFKQGQMVAVRDYRQDHSRWTPETTRIMAQTGPVLYSVEVASGGKCRRHTDQYAHQTYRFSKIHMYNLMIHLCPM